MKRFVLLLLALFAIAMPVSAAPSAIDSLALVVVAEPKLPPAEAVRSDLQNRLGKWLTLEKMETEDKVILFRVAAGTVAIGLIDRPIPNKELDDACRYAWDWKAACETVTGHKAHILVSILGTKLDKIDSALLLTQVVAALMQDPNALASYWGSNLQQRDNFLKRAATAKRDKLPVTLWVNIRLSNDALKGWTVSTRGMQKFDLMEIECKDARTDGRELLSLVLGMVSYLIENGPVIKDDDTIGDSPALNIRVRHAPSYWDAGRSVYRIVYP